MGPRRGRHSSRRLESTVQPRSHRRLSLRVREASAGLRGQIASCIALFWVAVGLTRAVALDGLTIVEIPLEPFFFSRAAPGDDRRLYGTLFRPPRTAVRRDRGVVLCGGFA